MANNFKAHGFLAHQANHGGRRQAAGLLWRGWFVTGVPEIGQVGRLAVVIMLFGFTRQPARVHMRAGIRGHWRALCVS